MDESINYMTAQHIRMIKQHGSQMLSAGCIEPSLQIVPFNVQWASGILSRGYRFQTEKDGYKIMPPPLPRCGLGRGGRTFAQLFTLQDWLAAHVLYSSHDMRGAEQSGWCVRSFVHISQSPVSHLRLAPELAVQLQGSVWSHRPSFQSWPGPQCCWLRAPLMLRQLAHSHASSEACHQAWQACTVLWGQPTALSSSAWGHRQDSAGGSQRSNRTLAWGPMLLAESTPHVAAAGS